jgi:predicted DNA-binding transcriptional regulator AlpA
MQWQAQGDTLLDIAAQVSTEMAKRNRAPRHPEEATIDRVIGMDELSRITGLSKYALYHLRSHRPSALPPALTGDAYRNSAKYLLSTVRTWLVQCASA